MWPKEQFCEEMEQVSDQFPNYHTKNVLGDFSGKLGREGTCFRTDSSERKSACTVHSEDSGAGVVTVGTTQDLMAREQCSQLETFTSAVMSVLLCTFAIRLTCDR